MPLTVTKIQELAKQDRRSPEEKAEALNKVIKALTLHSILADWQDSLVDDLWQAAQQSITDMGGNPESKAWQHVPYTVIFDLAEVAREAKELGLTVTVAPSRSRRKPGTKPMTPEEKMELHWRFLQSGRTQIEFSDFNIDASRYSTQQAKKYCDENPDNFRQFQAEKVRQSESTQAARKNDRRS